MSKKKIALIIGITGQDGSYLAEFLIKKNYIVHGMVRRSSMPNTQRIDHILAASRYENFAQKKILRANWSQQAKIDLNAIAMI